MKDIKFYLSETSPSSVINDRTMAEDITTSDGMEEYSNVRVVSPGIDVGVKCDFTPQRNRRSAVARYTPEFQKEVVEFGLRNKLCVTSRKFNVTTTTVGDWTRKARRARETGRG